MNPDAVNGTRYLLNHGTYYYLYVIDGSVVFGIRSGGAYTYVQSATITTGSWQHFAETYDGSTLTLYRNGVNLMQSSITGSIDATSLPIYIGSPGSGAYFDGRIDEVALYNKALTAGQMSAHYQRGALIRFDSFTTSNRTVGSDSFSGSPNTVFMRGAGLSEAQSYRIAYYATGGTKRFEEGPLSVSDGNLDSAVTTSNYPTASAGTWHAVVQRSGAPALPATYAGINLVTHEISADDAFTVMSSALPEFPSAALTACVAGAGCYRALRRRMSAARTAA